MKTNHKNHPDLPSDFSLESLRDQNPFRVPDGYFDELPQRISARIEANPIRTKTRRLHPGVFAAAASVVLLLGLTVVMRTSISNPSTESISNYSATELSSIPDTRIVNHLDKAITSGEIDESALMDVVATATAQEATSNTTNAEVQSESTGILPNVSDEDLINYLIQNQTPTSTTNDILKNDLN